jgi:hypothetical protein
MLSDATFSLLAMGADPIAKSQKPSDYAQDEARGYGKISRNAMRESSASQRDGVGNMKFIAFPAPP